TVSKVFFIRKIPKGSAKFVENSTSPSSESVSPTEFISRYSGVRIAWKGTIIDSRMRPKARREPPKLNFEKPYSARVATTAVRAAVDRDTTMLLSTGRSMTASEERKTEKFCQVR